MSRLAAIVAALAGVVFAIATSNQWDAGHHTNAVFIGVMSIFSFGIAVVLWSESENR